MMKRGKLLCALLLAWTGCTSDVDAPTVEILPVPGVELPKPADYYERVAKRRKTMMASGQLVRALGVTAQVRELEDPGDVEAAPNHFVLQWGDGVSYEIAIPMDAMPEIAAETPRSGAPHGQGDVGVVGEAVIVGGESRVRKSIDDVGAGIFVEIGRISGNSGGTGTFVGPLVEDGFDAAAFVLTAAHVSQDEFNGACVEGYREFSARKDSCKKVSNPTQDLPNCDTEPYGTWQSMAQMVPSYFVESGCCDVMIEYCGAYDWALLIVEPKNLNALWPGSMGYKDRGIGALAQLPLKTAGYPQAGHSDSPPFPCSGSCVSAWSTYTLYRENNVTMNFFPTTFGWEPPPLHTIDPPCVTGDRCKRHVYNADATYGQSGSPVYYYEGNDPYVVAVLSANAQVYLYPGAFQKVTRIVAAGFTQDTVAGFNWVIAWAQSNWF